MSNVIFDLNATVRVCSWTQQEFTSSMYFTAIEASAMGLMALTLLGTVQ